MERENRGRNILITAVIFIITVLIVIFLIRRSRNTNNLSLNPILPTPTSNFQQELKDNFGIVVPTNATKIDLNDVSGGNQIGLATLDKENNQNVYSVIANLEDPTSGYFYQAWLVRGSVGDANYDLVSLGKLYLAKGGWMTSYTTTKDLSDHKTIWVTSEKTFDSAPEKHILEGSF